MCSRKLLVVPGACNALGGTLVTLSLLIEGFIEQGKVDAIQVLVSADSVMQHYLTLAGYASVLEIIPNRGTSHFLSNALKWIAQAPVEWPLLLDNCVERSLLLDLIAAAPQLRLSGRPVYHFCHDLALSYNALGCWSRKLAFGLLKPKAICNSHFTKRHIQSLIADVAGVLYQPVDLEKFTPTLRVQPPTPPAVLAPILASGARIMLTPSRINLAGIVNDKNLRGLIPVLVELKQKGAFYHGVIIGEDRSPDQTNSKVLMEEAARFNVEDCFTILPPTFDIEQFYAFTDVVVTLAPREPFGRVVVEAIACGVPVIGSNTGGIGEVLGQVAPQWQIDPDSPAIVAQTILRVAEDPHTSATLQTARHWVEDHCSTARYAQQIMELTGIANHPENHVPLLSSLSS
ncbi:MAG TPA: glycosyltransferase family 4 protein [Stenomitos sp.]